MRDSKKGNVDKLTKLSGVGLRLQGGEIMQDKQQFRRPMKLQGNGLTLGGSCCMCGAGMDDKFIFGSVAL
jgi:hypothetical protein